MECPSPHSCLAGRGRKFLVVVSRYAHFRLDGDEVLARIKFHGSERSRVSLFQRRAGVNDV